MIPGQEKEEEEEEERGKKEEEKSMKGRKERKEGKERKGNCWVHVSFVSFFLFDLRDVVCVGPQLPQRRLQSRTEIGTMCPAEENQQKIPQQPGKCLFAGTD